MDIENGHLESTVPLSVTWCRSPTKTMVILHRRDCQNPPSRSPCHLCHSGLTARDKTPEEGRDSLMAVNMRHEVSFVRTHENQQTVSGPQGPPCLPLSQVHLGQAASPQAFRLPTSLSLRHRPAEGHTSTPHMCALCTVLHCQVQVHVAMPHTHPRSAWMTGVHTDSLPQHS